MKNKQKTILRIAGLIALFAVIGFSMAACASMGGGGVPLAAPQNVTAVQSAVTPPWRSITVTWAAVEGADRYRVTSIAPSGASLDTEVRGTSHTFNNNQPGMEMRYEVTALRGKRDVSPKSERVSVRTSAETQADITARAEARAQAEAAAAARAAAAEQARVAEANRIAAIENSPAFQQAIGTWRNQKDTITFPNRLNGSFVVSGRTGTITSFTNNAVTVDFGGGRFGILTFNYSISGNRLTVSNYIMGGVAVADMNGVYTKQ